jgi:hypothetical protein
VKCDGLGRHRHAAQAQAGGQRSAGSHALAQVPVLRAQPHGVAKGGGVLQRALQHLGVDQRHLGLAEAHTAGLGQLGHLGQHLALQAARQRAQREHPGLVQLFSAELQHLHQAGLVQHRVGVGRADQAGHATGHRGGQLAFQHAFMLMPGLAQAHGQVHQAWSHDAARGVNGLVGREFAAPCRWQ